VAIEESILVNATPAAVFEIYRQVDQWHRWDPDTKWAALDGFFEVGTKGRIVPTKGSGVPIQLTELVINRSFTVEGRVPLFRMKFEHELKPEGESTRVTHRVSFSGALSFLLGRIVGAQVREGLPKTMLSLKHYAESRV
jgi:hypothetical protein